MEPCGWTSKCEPYWCSRLLQLNNKWNLVCINIHAMKYSQTILAHLFTWSYCEYYPASPWAHAIRFEEAEVVTGIVGRIVCRNSFVHRRQVLVNILIHLCDIAQCNLWKEWWQNCCIYFGCSIFKPSVCKSLLRQFQGVHLGQIKLQSVSQSHLLVSVLQCDAWILLNPGRYSMYIFYLIYCF